MKQELILSVTQLNQQAKYLLEQSFPEILVEGEISNFICAGSGHWYFSLKDQSAQIRCAMFKGNNSRVRFAIRNGCQVIIKAKVTLYPARGDFQLVVSSLQESGVGKLQQQFEALKLELSKKGWFDDERKQLIPEMPHTIGVVTSPTGAAIRDIIRTLKRRFCTAQIIIYPTLVQGEQAAQQIANMITTANQRNEVDVLLVARGGGSIEDLWAFNEKIVAEAIFASQIPIVSGVGHQIDFTIADFVADLRAATPTAAAEVVSPDQRQLKEQLQKDRLKLQRLLQQLLEQQSQQLDWLTQRLRQAHPQQKLQQQQQQLHGLQRRLQLTQQNSLRSLRSQLDYLQSSLRRFHPQTKLQQTYEQLEQLQQRLHKSMQANLNHCQQQLASSARTLHTASPLATLERGYAVVKNNKSGQVVTDAKQLKKNDQLHIQFRQGCVISQIISQNDE